MTCSIDGCVKTPRARGWCEGHYRRWFRYGDPLADKSRWKLSMEERFWVKVNRDGPIPEARPDLGQCWIWTAALNGGGYGHLWVSGNVVDAHRVAHQLLVGPIPEGLVLDHLCRVRHCVNPAHLEAVTNQVNLSRGARWQPITSVRSAP